MPKWLIRFFERKDLSFHLVVALLIGLGFRWATAYFVYGPLAIDDFMDGVVPALSLAEGAWPELNIGRSYLLVWILTAILKVGQVLGIATQGVDKVRLMYAVMGVISLGTIFGAYLYARQIADKTFGALFIYLTSLYFFMPLLSTRTFGETVSMPWIMMGVGLLQWGRMERSPRFFMLGFISLAIACLFRFQNGLIFISCFLVLLAERKAHVWRAAVMGGAVWTLLQLTIDLLSYGRPFESFLGHLVVNRHGGSQYGSQPWYVHLALLTACSLFPFSLVFVRRIGSLMPRHRLAVYSLAVFVIVHTFVAHKEERYMSPILPLFLALMAATWSEARDSRWARYLYYPVFGVLNFGLLLIITVSNSQGSILSPVVDVQSRFDSGVFVDTNTDLERSFFTTRVYLNRSFSFRRESLQALNAERIDALLKQSGPEVLAILAFPDDGTEQELNRLTHLDSNLVRCSPIQRGSSLTDRIIYFLNPRRNTRRRPTLYVTCQHKKRIRPEVGG